MPLGVEHVAEKQRAVHAYAVPLPLMPLGVEHYCPMSLSLSRELVPLPLMPLGVEHSFRLRFVMNVARCLYL